MILYVLYVTILHFCLQFKCLLGKARMAKRVEGKGVVHYAIEEIKLKDDKSAKEERRFETIDHHQAYWICLHLCSKHAV